MPEFNRQDNCTVCEKPLGFETQMGDGDGSGHQFAHARCYHLRELNLFSAALAGYAACKDIPEPQLNERPENWAIRLLKWAQDNQGGIRAFVARFEGRA
jgi:hypothetical protein